MPSYNITVDDASPLWIYSGAWVEEDSYPDFYSNKTLHWTNATDASVSITFNGTGIYLYGGGADFNGSYTVTVDDQTYAPVPPTSREQTPLLLYAQDGLSRGLHTVTLTDSSNDPSRRLYLDRGVVTYGDGDKSTTRTDTIMDDTSSNITYSSGWTTSTIEFTKYFWGQTMHRQADGQSGITANIHFWGHSVTLFGALNVNHKNYTVSLDGGPAAWYNGKSAQYNAQAIMYIASDLEPTDHTLLVTLIEEAAFSIDYFVASTWSSSSNSSASPSGTNVPVSTSSSDNNDGGSSTPVGAIAGGVVGGVLAIAVAFIITFFLLRRRRRKRVVPGFRKEKGEIEAFPMEHRYAPPGGVAGGMSLNPQGGYTTLGDGSSDVSAHAGGARGDPRTPGTGASEFSGDGEEGRRWAGQETDMALMAPPGYDQVLAARMATAQPGARPYEAPQMLQGSAPAAGPLTGSDNGGRWGGARSPSAATETASSQYTGLTHGGHLEPASANTTQDVYDRVHNAYSGHMDEKSGRSTSQRGSRPLPVAPRR